MRAVAGIILAATMLLACSNGDDGDPAAFCARVEDLVDVEALIGGAAADQDPATSLRTAAERLRALGGEAPDEVAGDVRRIADAVEVLAEAAADPSVAVGARLAELDREALTRSATNLERYATEECGIDLSATTTSVPPGSPTPPAPSPGEGEAGG